MLLFIYLFRITFLYIIYWLKNCYFNIHKTSYILNYVLFYNSFFLVFETPILCNVWNIGLSRNKYETFIDDYKCKRLLYFNNIQGHTAISNVYFNILSYNVQINIILHKQNLKTKQTSKTLINKQFILIKLLR